MKKYIFGPMIIILGILTFNFFYLKSPEQTDHKKKSFVNKSYELAQSQDINNRVIKDTLQVQSRIDSSSYTFFRPRVIKGDNRGNIYILDHYKQKIIKFNKKNKFSGEIGGGKGAGPKEFLNITDFCIKDNIVYIADPILRKIALFKINGQFVSEFKTKSSILSFDVFKKNKIIYSSPNDENYLFILQDSSLVHGFFSSRLLNNQDHIIFNGSIHILDRNNFIFIFREAGMFFKYNIKSHLTTYSMKMIAPKNVSKVTYLDNGVIKLNNKRTLAYYSSCINNNSLFLLANIIKRGKQFYAQIDKYNLSNGSYAYTILIPAEENNPICSIYVTDTNIYSLDNFGFNIYRRQFNAEK